MKIDAKESRIIAFTGIYGCLIIANTSKVTHLVWFWTGLAIIYLGRYIYLTVKD